MSTPMRRIRSACFAHAASGHAAAAPPSSVMKSRRFNPSPRPHAAEWIFEPTPVATSRMKGLQPSSDFPGYALEIPEAPGLPPRKGSRVLHGEKEKFRLDVSFGTAP